MNIDIKPGKYLVAVSGGVDSMALLHMLVRQSQSNRKKTLGLQDSGARDSMNQYRFIVAHFDHGIREDSEIDRKLVQEIAEKHQLSFIYEEGKLGPNTSEATAREARYKFLEKTLKDNNAIAIITAHHQDDVIETAIINLLRGTGRSGLSSLKSHPHKLRPLLNIPKQDLIAYAKKHNLKWREDSTNEDTKYLRNYIRHVLMPRFSEEDREALLTHIQSAQKFNPEISKLLYHLYVPKGLEMDRKEFINLPHAVAKEAMAEWLRGNNIQFDRKLLEQITAKAKTLQPGKSIDVDVNYKIKIEKELLALRTRER